MDINLFKICSGLKVLGYFMILLVAAIIAVSYYAVVILTWGPQLLSGGFHSFLGFFIVIVIHILLILSVWSYFMVVFNDPGSVPENWRPMLSEENVEAGSSMTSSDYVAPEALSSSWATSDGSERRPPVAYCIRCQNGKPPRCHHCSFCQRCVLKMDHHCVWIVNCVGACNYKFFLLFLLLSILLGKKMLTTKNLGGKHFLCPYFSTAKQLQNASWCIYEYAWKLYTFLATTLDTFALLPKFIKFFNDAKNHSSSPGELAIIFLAFVVNLAFSASLLCFVVMHASLLLSNTTSVEVHEKEKTVRWKYDLGRKKNVEQVFGTSKALWLFPLFSKEDLDNIPALHGLDFPTCSDVEA